ncbi:hypothetical protein F5887DRAFT_964787 [Amanita rubescens]|nr:hypothetical protein F5887DRAFT_964787 [Amanita rubescens]
MRYLWLAQLDWTLKKAGKSRVWLNITRRKYCRKIQCGSVPLVTSRSRIVTLLLLKLAYNGCPLKFSSNEGWGYVHEKKVGKPRTARGKKTNQVRTMERWYWPGGDEAYVDGVIAR